VKAYHGQVPVFSETHPAHSHGQIGICAHFAKARFRRIKVTTPDGKVLFEGLPELVTNRVTAPSTI
jgi:hypothetical protein